MADTDNLPAVTNTATMAILANAIEKGVDIEVIERLVALNDAYEKKEAEKAFNRAFTAFQSELPIIAKDKNVHYEYGTKTVDYDHASMGNIVSTVTPLLSKNGLAYRFERHDIDVEGGFKIGIMGILTHIDGHFVTAIQYGPIDESGNKAELHGIASTTSYLERYVMLMLLGIATADEDDDGLAGARSASDKKPAPESNNSAKPKFKEDDLRDRMEKLFPETGKFVKARTGKIWAKLTAPEKIKMEHFVNAYEELIRIVNLCEKEDYKDLRAIYFESFQIDDPQMAKTDDLVDCAMSMYYRMWIEKASDRLEVTVWRARVDEAIGNQGLDHIDGMPKDALKELFDKLTRMIKANKS